MTYKNWMSFIKDDVRLTKVVMPGAHNAGSYGMNPTACCQNGNLYEQAVCGVRHYCIRLNTDRKGRIILSHGIAKGASLESAFADFARALEECPTEFFILDMREYYPQTFGPVTLHSKADPKQVDKLVAKYLNPGEYAFCDYNDISKVTMGDIRKSGKRYMIVNYIGAYKYSRDCENILPWDKDIYGMDTEKFVLQIPSIFDRYKTDGLYWFQTQQTPNIGTEIGFKYPLTLDKRLRPLFPMITEAIEDNPFYLESANIISGDFMTDSQMKCSLVIRLNLPKHNVREDAADEFAALVSST